jgi:3'-phosphoadenosine 5'-phosphosulfate sulfotransferase (PAPS reductase)/FAD synthetase
MSMSDPFKIIGPAVISTSGGRTSGYMLWRILQAHGGKLPEGVISVFQNTGKERDETLDFVEEMSIQWGVNIVWLEYRFVDGEHTFVQVAHETASRNGEPFDQIISNRSTLPNVKARYCTVELKVRTAHRYLFSKGWKEWDSVIGYRADEPTRLAKLGNQDYGKHEERIAPLAQAGITKYDVSEFWQQQPFDLRLPNINGTTPLGNCDCCFLKGLKLQSIIRAEPGRAVWWMNHEKAASADPTITGDGDRFRIDRPSYAQMYHVATHQVEAFPFEKYDDEPIQDCMCVD